MCERGIAVDHVLGQISQQPVRITDQSIDQLAAGLLVVPGNLRLTRIVLVIGPAVLGDHPGGTRHVAADPADSQRSAE